MPAKKKSSAKKSTKTTKSAAKKKAGGTTSTKKAGTTKKAVKPATKAPASVSTGLASPAPRIVTFDGVEVAWNAVAIAEAVAAGNVSAVAIATHALDLAEQHDPTLRAFLHLDRDAVLARAADVDDKRKRGETLGPLAGVPIGIKDNINVNGEPTTCASRILGAADALEQRFIAPYDACVIERLLAADAVPFGKTNLDEFAMGSSGENSSVAAARNPWDTDRVPGGSSSGSAAAVAAGIVPLALGSDTGGSIRQPASLTGIVGMKPTYGRVSRYGLVAFGSSLDQIGPFATTVDDAARLYAAIAGHDKRDATSLSHDIAIAPTDSFAPTSDKPLDGLTIGLIAEAFEEREDGAGLSSSVRKSVNAAIDKLRELGATTREVQLPHTRYGIAAYYVIADSECSANLSRFDGMRYGRRLPDPGNGATLADTYIETRSKGFGDEVKRRILLGTFSLASGYYDAYYMKACQVRRRLQDDFLDALKPVADKTGGNADGCDVLVCPTSPSTAFKIGERTSNLLEMYLSDVFTVSANLAGVPAISIPCGFDDTTTAAGHGLPIGVQVIGPLLGEAVMFRVAAALERALGTAS